MSYKYISVTPITPAIGAIIGDIDASKNLPDEVVDEIRKAFLEHQVIFLRNQRLNPKELVAFAARFGDIGYYPFVQGMEGQPEVTEVIKKEDETINFGGLWHTDTSYLETPPLGSFLYALRVPEAGGDTLFANMYLAYDSLSDGMKKLIGPLKGINSAEKPDAAVTRTNRAEERPKDAEAITTISSHPLVRTHPETGKKALYCSRAHTIHIEGMTVEESSPILEYLYQQQQREDFSCRFHWEPGSLAFWDNRAAQHNALNDYHGFRRVMHRVTLSGEKPY